MIAPSSVPVLKLDVIILRWMAIIAGSRIISQSSLDKKVLTSSVDACGSGQAFACRPQHVRDRCD
jgi:hypothetical protein